jgi:hypothetical protein
LGFVQVWTAVDDDEVGGVEEDEGDGDEDGLEQTSTCDRPAGGRAAKPGAILENHYERPGPYVMGYPRG